MKVLILCTANSCRSIIAEALVKAYLGYQVKSAGSKPRYEVNPLAKKVLEEEGIWSEEFYSKSIEDVLDEDFDVVVTVCDNAKEECPLFPKRTKVLHIPFEDPDKKGFDAFIRIKEEMKRRLLPSLAVIGQKPLF